MANIITGIGTLLNFNDNSGANTLLQTAASVAALESAANPLNTKFATIAATTGWAALGSAYLELQKDIASGNITAQRGDYAQMLGDITIVAGAVASEIPGGGVIGRGIEGLGSLTTIAGAYYSPTVQELLAEEDEENSFLSGNSSIPPMTATGQALGAITYELQNGGLSSITTAMQDIGTSGYNAAVNAVNTTINNFESSVKNLISVANAPVSNVNVTVNNNNFTLTDGAGSNVATTLTVGSNGNSSTLAVSGGNSSNNINETVAKGTDGTLTDTLQALNPNGTTQYTQTTNYSPTGVVTANISGTGDVANISGTGDPATFHDATITLSDHTTATINGVGDIINLSNNDSVTFGKGYSSELNTKNGSSIIFYSNTDAASLTYNNSVLRISGSDMTATLSLSENTTITGNSDVLTIDDKTFVPNPTVTVTGSNNTINMVVGDNVTISGNDNIIRAANNSKIVVAPNSQVTINGDEAGGLTITASAGDNITLNDYTAGSNHIIGSGAYTLILNGVSKGTGNNYGTFGFAGNKGVVQNYINHNASGNEALQEIQAAIASGSSGEILEGAKWDKETVTWNMGNIDKNSVFQHDIEAAFKAWSKSTGIDFVEVGNSNKADILLGFSNLDTATTGLVGYTNYGSNNGIFTSANISLENPNQDSLINTKDGLAYSGTNATFEQVAEHEIGHAIGFADNNNPNSIMNYYLGSSNQHLSSDDVIAANSLYDSNVAASSTFYRSSSLFGSGNQLLNNNIVVGSTSQSHHF